MNSLVLSFVCSCPLYVVVLFSDRGSSCVEAIDSIEKHFLEPRAVSLV